MAFAVTALLTTGGFMRMPFSSAYVVNNIGMHSLPMAYLATGLATIFCGSLVGKAADTFGKFRLFTLGTALSAAMVRVYTPRTSARSR